MSDINMEDIERNSPVVIAPTQEQQQQQQQMLTPSRSTSENAGGGGQVMKNRLKALLILRTPQPVEASPSNQNIVLGLCWYAYISQIKTGMATWIISLHCTHVSIHLDIDS